MALSLGVDVPVSNPSVEPDPAAPTFPTTSWSWSVPVAHAVSFLRPGPAPALLLCVTQAHLLTPALPFTWAQPCQGPCWVWMCLHPARSPGCLSLSAEVGSQPLLLTSLLPLPAAPGCELPNTLPRLATERSVHTRLQDQLRTNSPMKQQTLQDRTLRDMHPAHDSTVHVCACVHSFS